MADKNNPAEEAWKMKPTKVLLLLALVALTGCTGARSYSKPQSVLFPYKKIAVMKFANAKDPATGQEAADILALEFLNHKFPVVSSSQLTTFFSQDEYQNAGLTQGIKSRLKQEGIDALVSGTVNEYYCTNSGSVPTLRSLSRTNTCFVTLTTQMVDVNSGEILWGATSSESMEGDDATAKKVLLSLAEKFGKSIPEASPKPIAMK
jgi:hypothetical protein